MLPTDWVIRPNSSGQLLAENRGITELLLWYTEFSKTNSMVSKELNLVPDFPLKVPPIKSANARLLADNRGFTESFMDLSYKSQLFSIFYAAKHKYRKFRNTASLIPRLCATRLSSIFANVCWLKKITANFDFRKLL